MKRIEIFSSFFCRGVVLPFAVLAVSLICIACERDNTREIRPPVTEAVWVTDVGLPGDEIVAAVGDTFEVCGHGFGEEDLFRLVAEGGGTVKVYFLPMEAAPYAVW